MHHQKIHGENDKKELYDKAAEGHLYRSTGIKYFNEGYFQEAVDYHHLHLKICKEIDDRAGEGLAYGSLGNTYFNLGDLKEAIDYHQRQLNVCKELRDRAGEGRAYSNLGSDYYSLNDFTKAKEYHHLHLGITKEMGDRNGEKWACANLGKVYVGLGDFTKAIEYHRLHLSIAKQVGDRYGESSAFANLAVDYASLGNFRKAIQYHKLHLNTVQEIGDKVREGLVYTNLGIAYRNLGDFQTAIEYHQQQLRIAKDRNDRDEEGRAYASVGNCYRSLGDFRTAIKNYDLHLSVAKEIGDRDGEGRAYANLSATYCYLCDFKKAINCSQLHLVITKEVGNRAGEGQACSNLGDAYHGLGNFETAVEYHQLALSIFKEVKDKAREGHTYQSLGRDYCIQGDFKTGLEYYLLHLSTAKTEGDKAEEGIAYYHLGNTYNFLGDLSKAEESLKLSVTLFDSLRNDPQSNDRWQFSLRNYHKDTYDALWNVLLQQRNVNEALLTAERGRGQALKDLMESQYGLKSHRSLCGGGGENDVLTDVLSHISSQTVFLAVGPRAINFWVLNKGKDPHFVQKDIDQRYLKECVIASLVASNQHANSNIGVVESGRYEDRSLDAFRIEELRELGPNKKRTSPLNGWKEDPLRVLYDVVIAPIADIIHGDEISIVPDGPLLLAPFAAFKDQHSRYLSETLTVRLIPTITSLQIMAQTPKSHQSGNGVLLVGDPWVESIRIEKKEQKKEKKKRKKKAQKKVEVHGLPQLPAAKIEVELIAMILKAEPLTGKSATKEEVLRRLHSDALVHIAAHGKPETGEIALCPSPTKLSEILKEEEYLLTIEDVKNAKMQAKLVVLSCYHSGRGEAKSESVVNIARAFLAAGARSVLALLWAISDEATQEFMRNFYNNLAEGLSVSKCLSLAMKVMRESDRFSHVKHWAPFVLIGDDVTLDFGDAG